MIDQYEPCVNERRLTMRTVLKFFWSDWKIGLAVIVVLTACAGLISALLIPKITGSTPGEMHQMNLIAT